MLTTAHRHDDVRIYHKQAMTLAQNGWRVEILNPEYEGAGECGIHFTRIFLPDGRLPRMARGRVSALRAVLESRSSICQLHDPELLPLIPTLRRHGLVTVYDAHEDLEQSLRTKNWIFPPLRPIAARWGRELLRQYASRADGRIAATEAIACAMPGESTLVRNGVTRADCTRFDAAARIERPEAGTICYAGAITVQRGIERMIKACATAGVTLLLAGEFESPTLQKQMETLPEYACVRYLGRLDRESMARLYARSAAGLLLLSPTPAYCESEPIKLFEYACAGLPVIASGFPHWKEHFSALATFVPPQEDEVEQTAQSIRQVVFSSELREQAWNRREEVRKRYDFTPEAARLLALYRELEAGKNEYSAD